MHKWLFQGLDEPLLGALHAGKCRIVGCRTHHVAFLQKLWVDSWFVGRGPRRRGPCPHTPLLLGRILSSSIVEFDFRL